MRFGEIVREKRTALRISLEKLGRKTGLTKGYLSGIENGKVHPPLPRKVSRLCRVLDLDEASMLLLAYVEKAPEQIRGLETFKGFASNVSMFFREMGSTASL
jgi:transcriptional regulator with XRE-family HTH domain